MQPFSVLRSVTLRRVTWLEVSRVFVQAVTLASLLCSVTSVCSGSLLSYAYVDAQYAEDRVKLEVSLNGESGTTVPIAGFLVFQRAIGENPRVEIRITPTPVPWDPTTDYTGVLIDPLVEPDRLYRYVARMVDAEGNLLDSSVHWNTSIYAFVTTGDAVATRGVALFTHIPVVYACIGSDYPGTVVWGWQGEGAPPTYNSEVLMYGKFDKIYIENYWMPYLQVEKFVEASCNSVSVASEVWGTVKSLFR